MLLHVKLNQLNYVASLRAIADEHETLTAAHGKLADLPYLFYLYLYLFLFSFFFSFFLLLPRHGVFHKDDAL